MGAPVATDYCPLCGRKGHVGHSQDPLGRFKYIHCRFGCGYWRVNPDHSICRISLDSSKHLGARKYSCPQCGGVAKQKWTNNNNGLPYICISCEHCGRWYRRGTGEWYQKERYDFGRRITATARAEKAKITRKRHDLHFSNTQRHVKKYEQTLDQKMQNEKPPVMLNRLIIFNEDGSLALIEKTDTNVAPVCNGASLRGNVTVQRRWEIEERAEARRLAKEMKEVWDD